MGVYGVQRGATGQPGASGIGVLGYSENGRGVAGTSRTNSGVGGNSESASGVEGFSMNSIGVSGRSTFGVGVVGIGRTIAVSADSPLGVGVQAIGKKIAVLGVASNAQGFGVCGVNPGGYAGSFWGKLVATELIVGGPKQAAVPHRDGQHRLLYSMESPECWFEDFGKGKLRGGHARLRLRSDFAAVVRTATEYHVFLTAEGDCNGLFVAEKGRAGFEVRELRGGKSSVPFSYRIVAKRKDIPAPRLPKVKLPKLPEITPPARTSPPDFAAWTESSTMSRRGRSGRPRNKRRTE